jgi:dual specificity MAP kinase phosphatase
MDIIYNSCSYLRILSVKGYDYIQKYINGEKIIPVTRQIKLPIKTSIYNHIINIFLYPTNIIDNIYLGNGYNASNYSVIRDYNIKYIVNVTNEIPNYYEYNIISNNNSLCTTHNLDIKYLTIPIYDNSENHIYSHINKALEFIEEAQSNNDGNILIHCYMGSSRSASITLAYLIYKYNFTLSKGLKYLKKKRDIININTNFINDIKKYFNIDDE